MFLYVRVLPAVRPAVARGPGASQKVVDLSPGIRPAGHCLLRVKTNVSLCKLSSGRPTSATGGFAALYVTKCDIDP